MTTVQPAPAHPVRVPDEVIALHGEDLVIGRRVVERATVHVATVTRSHDQRVEETVTHQRVEIVRVPIGRFVDTAPPVREEGDLTILPVVEEVVVTERRLLLREEVHIRRVQQTEQHVETVMLRKQEVVVTRQPATETSPTFSNTSQTSGTSEP